MDYIMMAINMNWFWLGPYLVTCLGIGLVAQVVDLFSEEL